MFGFRRVVFRCTAFFCSVLGAGVGCSGTETPGSCDALDLLVLSSDGSASALVRVKGGKVTGTASGADLGRDPILAETGAGLCFVARDTDTLFSVDASCGAFRGKTELAPWIQKTNPGLGSVNFQDVATTGDGRTWLPAYNVPKLWIRSPETTSLTSIDLSGYDTDGNPEATSVLKYIVNGAERVGLLLNRLQRESATRVRAPVPALFLVIDPGAEKVVETHALKSRNPFWQKAIVGNYVYVPSAGEVDRIDEPDAGLERIDLETGEGTLLYDEGALGGSPISVDVAGSCAALVVMDASVKNATSLAMVRTDRREVLLSAANSTIRTDGFFFSRVRFSKDGRTLWVGNKEKHASGYAVETFGVDPDTCAIAKRAPIWVSMPPIDVHEARPQ